MSHLQALSTIPEPKGSPNRSNWLIASVVVVPLEIGLHLKPGRER